MKSKLARVLDWLRAGYPAGVPSTDYQPLLALLRRRLSDEEVKEVADQLVSMRPLEEDRIDAGVEITKVTDDTPSEEDIRRVLGRLNESEFPSEIEE